MVTVSSGEGLGPEEVGVGDELASPVVSVSRLTEDVEHAYSHRGSAMK